MIPQGLFRIAATARLITENHPGVLNKVNAEAGEVEKSAKTPKEGGQKPEEENKLLSSPQAGVPTSLGGALVLEKPVPLEPTKHLEITPIQIVSAGVVGDCFPNGSQQDPMHVSYGNARLYSPVQQPGIFYSNSVYPIPRLGPTAHQNTNRNGPPWEDIRDPSREKSGNKSPQSSIHESPILPATDRIPYGAPERSNDDMSTIISGSQYHRPPCVNGPGAMFFNAQSGPYGSTITARNPFPVSAPKPPVGIVGMLNQGPPRFGTANILHPMDQPTCPNNITSFPYHHPEAFSINPQQDQKSPFDEGDSVQLMPIIPNPAQIIHRIPGLTTLWPEIGNLGSPPDKGLNTQTR